MAVRKQNSIAVGGAQGSFTTIQTDAGTNPVATGITDTLTITSSNITVTGTAGTDTVTLAAKLATGAQEGIVSLAAQTMGAGYKTFAAGINSAVVTLTDGATPALDASLGNTFFLNSVTNPTIAVPTNAVNGQVIVIVFYAQTAARTLSLNASGFAFPVEIPALSATTGNQFDVITCKYSTRNNKWNVLAYTKGYA